MCSISRLLGYSGAILSVQSATGPAAFSEVPWSGIAPANVATRFSPSLSIAGVNGANPQSLREFAFTLSNLNVGTYYLQVSGSYNLSVTSANNVVINALIATGVVNYLNQTQNGIGVTNGNFSLVIPLTHSAPYVAFSVTITSLAGQPADVGTMTITSALLTLFP